MGNWGSAPLRPLGDCAEADLKLSHPRAEEVGHLPTTAQFIFGWGLLLGTLTPQHVLPAPCTWAEHASVDREPSGKRSQWEVTSVFGKIGTLCCNCPQGEVRSYYQKQRMGMQGRHKKQISIVAKLLTESTLTRQGSWFMTLSPPPQICACFWTEHL